MRAILILTVALAATLISAWPAAASCRSPEPVAVNAARAVMVVHGSVTSAENGSITLRIDKVFKGNPGPTLRLLAGPGRDAGRGGLAVSTSADYAASVGTQHVVYVVRGEDGQLETSACIGSHPGSPSTEETVFFGAGMSADPTSGQASVAPDVGTQSESLARPWAVAAALAFLAGVIVLGRRAHRSRAPKTLTQIQRPTLPDIEDDA